MKKFLLPLIILALMLLLPAVTFAADMPDIRELDSNIKLIDDADNEGLDDFETGCRTYVYMAPTGQEAFFAAQYTNRLLKTGKFQILSHYTEKDSNATNWDIIHLNYVGGGKKVAKFYHTGAKNSCNVDIHSTIGEGYVFITIATGLVYGYEKTVSPAVPVAPAPTPPSTPKPSTSTPTPQAASQPARTNSNEVPDFLTIGSNSVTFRKSQTNSDGTLSIFYDGRLNNDLREDFIGKYSNLLKQYGFNFVDYNKTKFNSKHLQKIRSSETWIFQNSSYGQVKLKRVRDSEKGTVAFTVTITTDLSYAANYVNPRRNVAQGSGQSCVACHGSGRCSECGGNRYVYKWDGVTGINRYEQCGHCLGSGNCPDCGGDGVL